MEKQNRKSFFTDKSSNRPRSDPLEHIFEIMDQALFFVNNVIDVNIQMQQIIIQIRKKLVKNQLATLKELYKVYLNCSKLEKFFNDKIYIFDIHNFDSISPQLFIRFYGRLSQKTFCKFLYYSLNYKSLQFLTSNLLELLDINDQLNNYKNIQNFNIFIEIISFILQENKILLEILFELIVSENYVSSIDQFFMSVPEKEIVENNISNKIPEGQSRKKKSDVRQELIIKPTNYSNYKEKLDSMIKNYQAKQQRDSFLNGFTLTLKKEFGILIENETKDNLFHIFEKQKLEKRSKKVSIKLQNDLYKKAKLNNKFDLSLSNQERQRLKLHQKSNVSDSEISASEKTRKISKGESNDFFVPTHSSNSMIRKSKIIQVDPNFLIIQKRNDQKNNQSLQKKQFLKKKNNWKHLKGQASTIVREKPKSAIDSNANSKRAKINKDLTEKYKNELKQIFDTIQNMKKMKLVKKIKKAKEIFQNPEESIFKTKSSFIYIPKSISNFVLKYQINIGKHKSHFQNPSVKPNSIHHNSNNQDFNFCAQNSFKPNEQLQQLSCHNYKKLEHSETEDKYWYQNHFKHKNEFTITNNYFKQQTNKPQKDKLIFKVKKPRHQIFSTHQHKLIYPS